MMCMPEEMKVQVLISAASSFNQNALYLSPNCSEHINEMKAFGLTVMLSHVKPEVII